MKPFGIGAISADRSVYKQVFVVLIFIFIFALVFLSSSHISNASLTKSQIGLMEFTGIVGGQGTYFEITNSDYLNISLTSVEEVSVTLQSIPKTIILEIASLSPATNTKIIIKGLLPDTTYYKYEDNYRNLTEIHTDISGSYVYTQNISNRHIVFIQPNKSTKFIVDDGTGGDCTSIGVWDIGTKTCTLTTDLTETIQIDSDNVTLDGNGHSTTGTKSGSGIFVPTLSGVTVKNIFVDNFSIGLYLNSSSGNTLMDNFVSNASLGVYVYRSSDNTISSNVLSDNNQAIQSLSSNNNIFIENKITSKPLRIAPQGIVLLDSSNTILEGNMVNLSGAESLNSPQGVLLFSSFDNTIFNNDIVNTNQGVLLFSSYRNRLVGNTITENVEDGLSLFNSYDNSIYNNNFIDNGKSDAKSFGETLNTFNLPKPTGGNYWSKFDEEVEGCIDLGNDSFCDSSRIFDGGEDALPWAVESGWGAVQPDPETDRLILKYEPILYLHPDETYFPMNVDAYVEHSSLWDDRGILSDKLLKQESELDPITLDYIATTTDTTDWYLAFSNGSRSKSFDPTVARTKYNELVEGGIATTTYYARKMEDSFIDDVGILHEFIVL